MDFFPLAGLVAQNVIFISADVFMFGCYVHVTCSSGVVWVCFALLINKTNSANNCKSCVYLMRLQRHQLHLLSRGFSL